MEPIIAFINLAPNDIAVIPTVLPASIAIIGSKETKREENMVALWLDVTNTGMTRGGEWVCNVIQIGGNKQFTFGPAPEQINIHPNPPAPPAMAPGGGQKLNRKQRRALPVAKSGAVGGPLGEVVPSIKDAE